MPNERFSERPQSPDPVRPGLPSLPQQEGIQGLGENHITRFTWMNILTRTTRLSSSEIPGAIRDPLLAESTNGLFDAAIAEGLPADSEVGTVTYIPGLPTEHPTYNKSLIAETFHDRLGVDADGQIILAKFEVSLASDDVDEDGYPSRDDVSASFKITDLGRVRCDVVVRRPFQGSEQPDPDLQAEIDSTGIPTNLEELYSRGSDKRILEVKEVEVDDAHGQKLSHMLRDIG